MGLTLSVSSVIRAMRTCVSLPDLSDREDPARPQGVDSVSEDQREDPSAPLTGAAARGMGWNGMKDSP